MHFESRCTWAGGLFHGECSWEQCNSAEGVEASAVERVRSSCSNMLACCEISSKQLSALHCITLMQYDCGIIVGVSSHSQGVPVTMIVRKADVADSINQKHINPAHQSDLILPDAGALEAHLADRLAHTVAHPMHVASLSTCHCLRLICASSYLYQSLRRRTRQRDLPTPTSFSTQCRCSFLAMR